MIYIHIPFCKSICSYCDFYHSISINKKNEIIDAIIHEIQRRKEFITEPVKTIYFGGGTPSILKLEQIEKIINVIKQNWKMELEEVTFEANPEDISNDYVTGLKTMGVNRISLGIQSFNDKHLKIFNRRHNAQKAIKAIEIIKNTGIQNISIDLIYGMPFLTNKEWRKNIQITMEMDVEHLSAYHLTIEKKTAFGKQKMQPVADQVSQDQYDIICETMAKNGWEHYEISNFAKINRRSKHNSAYWNETHYLGVGPSAHSYDGKTRHWNVASNALYLNGNTGESELLTTENIYNERIMTALRTVDGLKKPDEKLLKRAQKFLEKGDLTYNNGILNIPENKWLISDYIIAELFM